MKKLTIASLVVALFTSCNGSGSKDDKPGKATADITANPDYQKGLGLVAKNKCLTCHAVDQTITGPPYREVAKKYADMPDTIVAHLARKIINGGNGVWGQIFMTPNGVSQEDAEAMVKYILLLDKK